MMAEADPGPLQPEEPLLIEGVERIILEKDAPGAPETGLMISFNRPPTDREVRMYRELPPTPQMFADVRSYASRMDLAELVVKLFRFYVLGSIVLPDTPIAMDWLKTFIDGVGHGPVGQGPMRWPRTCASACNILERWGYEPTKSEPPYVAKMIKAKRADG